MEGNSLIVRMSTGEIRHIVASSSQRALIDGKEVAAQDLKVGTRLKATVTTITVDRTVTVGSGKVWYVAPPNVILTLPNGENRQYKAADDYKFMVEGKPATVFDLRKGMRVSAQRIVEEPRTEVAANTVVTGELPPPVQTASSPAPSAPPVSKPPPSRPAPPKCHPPRPRPRNQPPLPPLPLLPLSAPLPTPLLLPPSPLLRLPLLPLSRHPHTEPAQTSRTMLWVGLIIAVLIAATSVSARRSASSSRPPGM